MCIKLINLFIMLHNITRYYFHSTKCKNISTEFKSKHTAKKTLLLVQEVEGHMI